MEAMSNARLPSEVNIVIDAAATFGDIHASHTLRMLRNAVFCQKCGYWRIKRARGLADPCRGQPREGHISKLTRLQSGLHPDLKPWPDGAPGDIPWPVYTTHHSDGNVYAKLCRDQGAVGKR